MHRGNIHENILDLLSKQIGQIQEIHLFSTSMSINVNSHEEQQIYLFQANHIKSWYNHQLLLPQFLLISQNFNKEKKPELQ